MENIEKKINLEDGQVEQVSGGKVGRYYSLTCKRCGKTFIGIISDEMCPECVEATTIHTTENGAYGGW